MRDKLLGSVKALYKESKVCVRVEGDVTEEVVVEQGLRQGCPLSPWLFNMFLDRIAREAMVGFHGGVELDSCLIHILMSADGRHSDDGPDSRRPKPESEKIP